MSPVVLRLEMGWTGNCSRYNSGQSTLEFAFAASDTVLIHIDILNPLPKPVPTRTVTVVENRILSTRADQRCECEVWVVGVYW